MKQTIEILLSSIKFSEFLCLLGDLTFYTFIAFPLWVWAQLLVQPRQAGSVLTLIFSLTSKGAEESDRIIEHTFACAWKQVADRDHTRRFYDILCFFFPSLSGTNNSLMRQIDYKRTRKYCRPSLFSLQLPGSWLIRRYFNTIKKNGVDKALIQMLGINIFQPEQSHSCSTICSLFSMRPSGHSPSNGCFSRSSQGITAKGISGSQGPWNPWTKWSSTTRMRAPTGPFFGNLRDMVLHDGTRKQSGWWGLEPRCSHLTTRM